jgi:NAD(P)-dependent dehydrogenase (short-subunit alcohol dehydrogenase family)
MRGSEMGSLYCATKWAVEGFSEALAVELEPFGIQVTIIEPGPFRTDFLTPGSIRFGAKAIPDYEERRTAQRATFEQRDGKQPGDPVKLAEAVVRLASEPEPPLRIAAGSIAFDTISAKLVDMQTELERWRPLSVGMDLA